MKKWLGAQMGAHVMAYIIYLLFFIYLNDDLSPAFAPSDMQIKGYLRVAFFLPQALKIQL
ncbi:hypothetical protein [Yokenella regensburgei]|uniref:hypothetical protein n=1 Tax=Yokenella regensburgei TaxID=158877 RepID=UPI0020770F64|nr:hypothetical protein [Yokenella regensburgei]